MSAALSFRDIHKVFVSSQGETIALAGLSLDIEPNKFTAIVGPSGCGKSTLLHIAAGLDTRFGGALTIPSQNQRLACVFQAPRLLPWRTAQKNVEFVLSENHSRRDRAQKAQEMLHLVGLAGFEDRFPNQLSGGMQQRVSLARALAIEPSVLLMDEPFGALDELTARRLRIELLRLHKEQPRTVLFVTHNVTEAAFLADRVIVLSARPGRIVADIREATPHPRDYESPEVASVARQILRNLELH